MFVPFKYRKHSTNTISPKISDDGKQYVEEMWKLSLRDASFVCTVAMQLTASPGKNTQLTKFKGIKLSKRKQIRNLRQTRDTKKIYKNIGSVLVLVVSVCRWASIGRCLQLQLFAPKMPLTVPQYRERHTHFGRTSLRTMCVCMKAYEQMG